MKLVTRTHLLALAFLAILLLASGGWAQGKYKILNAFPPARATSWEGGLVLDAAGNLFGTTMYGGKYNLGQVFKLTRNADGSWKESAIYSFSGTDGEFPTDGLIFDSAGDRYGTTYLGGSAGSGGTVFKLAPTKRGKWRESVLHSFARSQDGWAPVAGLILDQSGNLYGTTPYSDGGESYAGTVFKVSPSKDGTWSETVLYTFCSKPKCADGETPYANLVLDAAGNLYGTTTTGGANNDGTVFKLVPTEDGSWSESVLYSFCSLAGCSDGASPFDGLIFDGAGNLYGTAQGWGAFDGGVVFELTPTDGTWSESVLYNFCSQTGCSDGSGPLSNLTFDTAGNLYGTTLGGGNTKSCYNWGCGTVFELMPNSNGQWNESVLHAFADRPGIAPYAGVVFDAAGNLYGTTTGIKGTTVVAVFQITP
jgi:uncharacterized repeat protein (TIGR03803 family)